MPYNARPVSYTHRGLVAFFNPGNVCEPEMLSGARYDCKVCLLYTSQVLQARNSFETGRMALNSLIGMPLESETEVQAVSYTHLV